MTEDIDSYDNWQGDGYRVFKIPKKFYSQKFDVSAAFSDLSPTEKVVFSSYQIATLREIAQTLNMSHSGIRSIYIRAYNKIRRYKNGKKSHRST
jgi:DNA-directed RNA polymerase sigma subunit (sigma70/sigma32)